MASRNASSGVGRSGERVGGGLGGCDAWVLGSGTVEAPLRRTAFEEDIVVRIGCVRSTCDRVNRDVRYARSSSLK